MSESTEGILQEVAAERSHQDSMWGNSFDDRNTPNDWVAFITHYASKAAYDGNKGEYSREGFRRHMIKAAALCVAAVETLDRNTRLAPRHYDLEVRR